MDLALPLSVDSLLGGAGCDDSQSGSIVCAGSDLD